MIKTKLFIFCLAIFILQFTCCKSDKITPELAVKNYTILQIDVLIVKLDAIQASTKAKSSLTNLQSQFLNSRLQYKKIEAIVEYYFQGVSRRINGPALPDIKIDDSQVWPAHGLQMIEQLLYSTDTASLEKSLNEEINILKADLLFVKSNLKDQNILPRHFQELLQHQCVRMASLGMSGFDTPLCKNAIPELLSSLTSIYEMYQIYYASKSIENVYEACKSDIEKQGNDFDDFDRLNFLCNQLIPLSEAIANEHSMENDKAFVQAFKGTLKDLMIGKGLNADYYTNYAVGYTNTEKIKLGERLFYDTQLSQSNSISCGTCHQENLFFTDGKVKAENLVHGGSLARNTPTLFYAAFQSRQFYDMRSTSLEDQISEVIQNTNEFNSNTSHIEQQLEKDTFYLSQFKKAFKNTDSINSYMIRNSIAAYVRSLSPFQSNFDYYMRGDKTALAKEEKQGFNIFMGKGKCGTCHFIPLFNGNAPPLLNQSESEVIGVPEKNVWANAKLDPDSGRYKINAMVPLLAAFKTPTIRNIKQTAPYMHNGVYTNLEDIITFYQKGGGVGIGISLPHQTLPFDSLVLNEKEKRAIVRFMESLTDKGVGVKK